MADRYCVIRRGAVRRLASAAADRELTSVVGWGPLAVGTVVSFVVAYASIAWLLRLVVRHPITVFIGYRVLAGLALIGLLVGGVVNAT